MVSQIPGKGAKYLLSFTDSDGTALCGESSYRVKLPPNIPAANFWSMTVYDAETGSGLANGQPFPSLGSRDKPVQNADGSTDLYFGPRRPRAKNETGSRPCRAKDTSSSSGCTPPPRLPSTKAGSLGTLKSL
jgi:hypothetical protein